MRTKHVNANRPRFFSTVVRHFLMLAIAFLSMGLVLFLTAAVVSQTEAPPYSYVLTMEFFLGLLFLLIGTWSLTEHIQITKKRAKVQAVHRRPHLVR